MLDYENKITPEQLVQVSYSYENIIQNPVLKPIAETDRVIQDLDEMLNKKLIDSKKDRDWIEKVLVDAPEYSESIFVGRLLKLIQEIDDIIKIYVLRNSNLVSCLRESVEIVSSRYGLRVGKAEGDKVMIKQNKQIIPGGDERTYLENLTKNKDNPDIAEISTKLLELFDSSPEENLNKRFYEVCGKYYTQLTEKKDKDILAKILRMTI